MPARSIRSPPASCRSRSARRPRPCRSSWTARKSYVFTVAWGVETDTDDAEGAVVAGDRYAARSAPTIEALLPRFTGQIEQVPPRFSAIKIQGERAYDLARDGEAVELQPRTVEIDRARSSMHERRAQRVRGRLRQGHLCPRARPRPRPRARLPRPCRGAAADARRPVQRGRRRGGGRSRRSRARRPAAPGRDGARRAALDRRRRDMAGRLMRGQSVILRGRDAPISGKIYATCGGVLVAVGDVEQGELVPHRVFNLGAGNTPRLRGTVLVPIRLPAALLHAPDTCG